MNLRKIPLNTTGVSPARLAQQQTWNPDAPKFMDVMKQHHAFVKRMTSDQGELRGVAIFRVGTEQTAKLMQDDPAIRAGVVKTEIHPWGTGKGVLASGQPMQ